MGSEQFGKNQRAFEQNTDRKNGGYGGDYYDENEHRAGQEKRDLATGEAFKNDGDIKPIAVEEVTTEEQSEREALFRDEFEDATEKWLRDNDPDYIGLGNVKEEGNDQKRAA